MKLTDIFDKALKKSQGGKGEDYYSSERVLKEKYYSYITYDEWSKFRKGMSEKDRKAYDNGGGKELEEKCYKGVWIPPKMASYASSSRFVYNRLKGTNVIFEQKLPTLISRSTSNMDAFYPDKNIFIEAKCHEIYSSPSPKYKIAFKEFYDKLAKKTRFTYTPTEEKNDAPVTFTIDNEPVTQFDIKQIIAHMLGIANACKEGVKINGEKKQLDLNNGISFIYLLYNPQDLKIHLNEKDWNKIETKWNNEVDFIEKHHSFFKELFGVALEYVEFDCSKRKELEEKFEFKLADQFNYKDIIGIE